MFRQLSDDETTEFKQWARENYKPGEAINSLWHPVVQEEAQKMNVEAPSPAVALYAAGEVDADTCAKMMALEFARDVLGIEGEGLAAFEDQLKEGSE